jgi:hypothetical protein
VGREAASVRVALGVLVARGVRVGPAPIGVRVGRGVFVTRGVLVSRGVRVGSAKMGVRVGRGVLVGRRVLVAGPVVVGRRVGVSAGRAVAVAGGAVPASRGVFVGGGSIDPVSPTATRLQLITPVVPTWPSSASASTSTETSRKPSPKRRPFHLNVAVLPFKSSRTGRGLVWKKIDAVPTFVAESWLGLTFFKEPPEMLSTETTIWAWPELSVIEQRPPILSPGACANALPGRVTNTPTRAMNSITLRRILDPPTLLS